MEKKIRIITGELKVEAELNDSKTAQSIWDALPIEASNNLWGEEIYFPIPVKAGQEKGSREVVSAGELGYWPPGHAFCIFFGPTPASRGMRFAQPALSTSSVRSSPTLSLPEGQRRRQDHRRESLKP